ncbi:conserved hypothetical protein (DUF4145 domain) [Aliarcobacter butzleri 7h1h]|uniref:DUF4145 domain-containing protein n=1 Tax=Aliarcobacter butzleri TaxID=28197 RepID=UPI0002DC829E|nr:DUF4145 domain-containing protein [Aliarcobacter butzleri]AGR78340.1 conserved hypothetical protein (DUF4145 domain) [Aliarcobacter butzleri 7h1h]KLE11684.1 hypothetical protein AF79_00595 [Aliarcobacter butzleri L354]MCG3694973.1 DUF4145 domain-containing protein [Aliarcobacter butzleri]MDN5073878.1 DUF4145 domain-containing protein [Aliarcobacter butzleri]MDN5120762.1 DUF4145 domain-containing protein [Aliarcobacter butzleri]
MAEIITDCPRCGAKKTSFDIKGSSIININGWKHTLELYCICRHCKNGTIFIVSQKNLSEITSIVSKKENVNYLIDILKYINIKENSTEKPPLYLPKDINEVFQEGITCKSVECYNASATMFRLCLDKATKILLPEEDKNGLNNKIRRSLGLRLEWLIKNDYISKSLEDLMSCIKGDGNDGAHEGIVTKEVLEDIYEFTYILLERLYTEPKKVQLAKERREERHKK